MTFWDRISVLSTRIQNTPNARAELKEAIERLYWEADHHGLECADRYCKCSEDTHQVTYRSLWARLEFLEGMKR
jgi:hypothetical protein